MLASIVENAGLVTVFATPQDDTVVISSATAGFTDISINAGQSGSQLARFTTSQIDKVVVWAGAGNDSVYSSARVPTEVNGQNGDDILQGGFVDDIVRGGGGENRLFGRAGNDTLVGGPAIDRIFGANGNDSIFGNGGNDYLVGHGGNDTISGGAGNDNIQAGAGDDTIYGGTGNDNIAGHGGSDVMYGNEGNDSINGGGGNDLVAGQAGNDTLNGADGSDIINGSFGNDLLLGFDGNDTLDGGEGVDTLYGGNGEDFLEGGFDTVVDRLNGGAQNDTFVQRGGDILEDVSNGNGLDSVLDYSVDNDDNDDNDNNADPRFQSFRAEFFQQIVPPPVGPAFSATANIQFATLPAVYVPLSDAILNASPGGTPIAAGDAYNCHSHAWHNRQGEPGIITQDPNVLPIPGSPRWDNSAIDDMAAATRLNNTDTPQEGDVVVYGIDENGDGFINTAEEATHSALVTEVVGGQITEVQSKPGQAGEINHHPNDPRMRFHYGAPTFIFRK